MTTIEGNKLIAEFNEDEIKLTSDHPDVKIWIRNKHTKRFSKDSYWPINSAQYDCSWDWLMPVVEKIENTNRVNDNEYYPYMVTIWKNCCLITDGNNGYDVIRIYSETKIESIWLAVVAFIKWYNKQS